MGSIKSFILRFPKSFWYFLLIIAIPQILFRYIKTPYNLMLMLLCWGFVCIALYKFFIKNSKYSTKKEEETLTEHPLDDNMFIAITSIVAVIGLIFTIYSRALIENNNDISNLLRNSLTNESVYKIPTDLIIKKNYIICIDKSGSVNEEFTKFPKRINKDYVKDLLGKLGIEIDDDNVYDNFVKDGLKNKKRSFLNKIKALELILRYRNLYSNSAHIVLFGNNSVLKTKPNNKVDNSVAIMPRFPLMLCH